MNHTDDSISQIIDKLTETGWIELPGFLSNTQLVEFRELAQKYLQQGDFRQAAIGSGNQRINNTDIRSDQIFWLEQTSPEALIEPPNHVLTGFQQFLDNLRLQINQSLFLGLFETEYHFALYPPGGCYQKHIDNFQGRSPRKLTFVLYLNEGWSAEDGGQLRLYLEGGNERAFTDITPHGGSLIIFQSERFYHEVLPANQARLSLTGWLRCRED